VTLLEVLLLADETVDEVITEAVDETMEEVIEVIDKEVVEDSADPPQVAPPVKVIQLPASSLAALKLSETTSAPLPLKMSNLAL
jgi:hypothetical protein